MLQNIFNLKYILVKLVDKTTVTVHNYHKTKKIPIGTY